MFTNIDSLPLGKLLQPKQQGGVSKQTAGGRIRKLRKKMPNAFDKPRK